MNVQRLLGRRHLFVLALVTGFSLVPLTSSSAPEPYVINVITSATGTAAFLGKEEAVALKVLQATLNKSGGIKGRPIQFAIKDDQSNPQIAVQLAGVIVAQKPAVMLGPTISGNCNAVSPLMKDGPVDICFSPGIHPAEGSFVFSPSASSADIAVYTARYFRDHNLHNVAFIYSTDGSGQDGEQSMRGVLAQPENRDLHVVDNEHFAVTDISVAAQIARIKSSGAQMVDIWTSGTPLGTVLRAISDAGLTIPVITSWSNATYDQMNAYKSFLPKDLLFVAPPDLATDVMAKEPPGQPGSVFHQAFVSAGVRPEAGYVTSWDPTLLVVGALRFLGPNATAEQLRTYLAGVHYWMGANGVYDFHAYPQRGIADRSLIMIHWDPAQATWNQYKD
jgi:branched-chain amino acid transport system substrate-binding protein